MLCVCTKFHMEKLRLIRKRSQVHLPALANDHMVSFLDTEAGGDVGWDVRVPLLIPVQV